MLIRAGRGRMRLPTTAAARLDAGETPRSGGASSFRSGLDNDLALEAVAACGPRRGLHAAGPAPAPSIHHDPAAQRHRLPAARPAARRAEQIATWAQRRRRRLQHLGQRLHACAWRRLPRRWRAPARGRRGVASCASPRRGLGVHSSDKDSAFASDEARDSLHWLRAVAAARWPARARRACHPQRGLADRGAGLACQRRRGLRCAQRAGAALPRRGWREPGAPTMLRRTSHALDLPARRLADADGERRSFPQLRIRRIAAAGQRLA